MKKAWLLLLSLCMLISSSNLFANTVYPTIYPNPANNVVFVTLNKSQKIDITIYSLLGNKIKTISANSNSVKIDITDLKSGIYILQVATSENTKSVRLRVI